LVTYYRKLKEKVIPEERALHIDGTFIDRMGAVIFYPVSQL
jgi:hypothetical protein